MIGVEQVETAIRSAPTLAAGPVVFGGQSCPAPTTEGEVVVGGRNDDEAFLLRPVPPPPADGLRSHPLDVQLAPGVSFGFQREGGFGLRTESGPGRKSREDGK